MKLLHNGFGLNQSSNRFLYQEAIKSPDQSPTLESENSLKKLMNLVLNCNKKETDYKFDGEKKNLKNLRDLKIDDEKTFADIQVNLDELEKGNQADLSKYGDNIVEKTKAFQLAKEEYEKSETDFETARNIDGSNRKEKGASRKNRRVDRKAMKNAYQELKSAIVEFQKPFRIAFKKFNNVHEKNLQIQTFTKKQLDTRKALLASRISFQTSFKDSKIQNKRDAAVAEMAKLVEEAEIADKNAEALVTSSSRVLNDYKKINESLDFNILKGGLFWKNKDLKKISNQEIILKSANMVSVSEAEKLDGLKKADDYKIQSGFSPLQQKYNEAKQTLEATKDSKYVTATDIQKAETAKIAVESQLKTNWTKFSTLAITKQNTLEKNESESTKKLETEIFAFKNKLKTIVERLKRQVFTAAQQNNGIETDINAERAIAKAENILDDSLSDFATNKHLDSDINFILSAAVLTKAELADSNFKKLIDTKNLIESIKNYQTASDFAKEHKDNVLKEAAEYGRLGIAGISGSPFDNQALLTEIKKDKERKIKKQEQLKQDKIEQKEIGEKLEKISSKIEALFVDIDAIDENVMDLLENDKDFRKAITTAFFADFRKNGKNISFEGIMDKLFPKIDTNIRDSFIVNIKKSNEFKTYIEKSIEKLLDVDPKNNNNPDKNNEKNEEQEKFNKLLEKVDLGALIGLKKSNPIFTEGKTTLKGFMDSTLNLEYLKPLGGVKIGKLKEWLKQSPYAQDFLNSTKPSLGLWLDHIEKNYTELNPKTQEEIEKEEKEEWKKSISRIDIGALADLSIDHEIWDEGKTSLKNLRDEMISIRDFGVLGSDNTKKLKNWLKQSPYAQAFLDSKYTTIRLWIKSNPSVITNPKTQEEIEEEEKEEWKKSISRIDIGALADLSIDHEIWDEGKTSLKNLRDEMISIRDFGVLGSDNTKKLKNWLKQSPYAQAFLDSKYTTIRLWIKSNPSVITNPKTQEEIEEEKQKKWAKKLPSVGLGSLAHVKRENRIWTAGKDVLGKVRDDWAWRDWLNMDNTVGSLGALREHSDLKAWLNGEEGQKFFADPNYQTLEEWINKTPGSTTNVVTTITTPIALKYDYEDLTQNTKVPNYVIEEGTDVFDETWTDLSGKMDLGKTDFNKLRTINRSSLIDLKKSFNETPNDPIWKEVSKKIGFIDVEDFKKFTGTNEFTNFVISGKENLTQYFNKKLTNNIEKKLKNYGLTKSTDNDRFEALDSIEIYKLIENNKEILDGGKICDSFRSLLNLPTNFWKQGNSGVFQLSENNIQTFITHRDKTNSSFDDNLQTFEAKGDEFEVDGSGFFWDHDFDNVDNFFHWLETDNDID